MQRLAIDVQNSVQKCVTGLMSLSAKKNRHSFAAILEFNRRP